jgi:hypothetical protein
MDENPLISFPSMFASIIWSSIDENICAISNFTSGFSLAKSGDTFDSHYKGDVCLNFGDLRGL